MVAEFFGLDPFAIMRSWTNRQYLAVCTWLKHRYNQPSLTELHLMSIATEVRRGYAKNPRQVLLKDLQLEFKFDNQSDLGDMTQEELKEWSDWMKQAYLARWGMKHGPEKA